MFKEEKQMAKKLIALFLVAAVLLCGCCSKTPDKSNTYTDVTVTNSSPTQSGFNDESYIWEIFVFPTNRTER